MPATSTVLFRAVAPLTIRIERRGTSSARARVSTTASFAASSTGGAVTRTSNRPLRTPSIFVRDDLGITRKSMRTPVGVVETAGVIRTHMKTDALEGFLGFPPESSCLHSSCVNCDWRPATEDRAADTDDRGPFFDGHFEIVAHAHRQIREGGGWCPGCDERVAEVAEPLEPRPRGLRVFRNRRHDHQAAQLNGLGVERGF